MLVGIKLVGVEVCYKREFDDFYRLYLAITYNYFVQKQIYR